MAQKAEQAGVGAQPQPIERGLHLAAQLPVAADAEFDPRELVARPGDGLEGEGQALLLAERGAEEDPHGLGRPLRRAPLERVAVHLDGDALHVCLLRRTARLDEALKVMVKLQLGMELEPGQLEELTAFLESLTGKLDPELEKDPWAATGG